MVHKPRTRVAEQRRNKSKPSFFEGKGKWPIQEPGELLLQLQPVLEGKEMQIWLQSLCTACRGTARSQADKGQGCCGSRAALKPHTLKHHRLPLGSVLYFISLTIYSSVLSTNTRAQQNMGEKKKKTTKKSGFLPTFYCTNWRREVLTELCLLIQISKAKFCYWRVWLEDQHML